MASLKIESGEFPLMRNVDVSRQPERANIYNEWARIFHYSLPDAVEHLADVIEDVYAFELWKDKYLETPEQFFERLGLFDLDLDEPAKLIKELRKSRSDKKAQIIAQAKKWKARMEAGESIRDIAESDGVPKTTVHRRVSQSESPDTKSGTENPRKRDRYEISQYTKPETAAQRIRETFGDDFAIQLGTLLVSQ